MPCSEALAQDTMWGGRLTLWQPARKGGYRFNVDSILLAGFAAAREGPLGHVLDLGAGCGIIGLMLLAAGRAERLTCVERQPALADCVRRNSAANNLQHVVTVLQQDLRAEGLPHADVVVFNPPYFQVGRGLASADAGRDAGRREVHGTLDDFLMSAQKALLPHGCIMAVFPEARAQQFVATASALGLHLQRQRAVHAFAQGPAKHRLVQLGRSPDSGSTLNLQPLVVHTGTQGRYGPEVQALIEGVLPRGEATAV